MNQAQASNCRHLIHPWADLSVSTTQKKLIIAKAQGIYIYDETGKSYIDGIAGMWCVNIGHGREEMADTIAQQIRTLDYYTPFGDVTSPPAIELAETLAKRSPLDLNRVQFSCSGSGAVESAIRFSHYFFKSQGQDSKRHIISREDAYHGSTYLTASLSGKKVDKTHFHYIEDFVHHLPSPNYLRFGNEFNESEDVFFQRQAQYLEDKILQLGADNVACFIAEPILASGGIIIPSIEYHRTVRDICRRYGVLYISDEVVTAFGRLGELFTSQVLFELEPDIITVAKGLTSGYIPMGATLISDRLFEQISGSRAGKTPYFTNGFTYSGHPVSCAAAIKSLEIIEKENLCYHVKEVGPYFIQALKTLEQFDSVGVVRGMHLMACVEFRIGKHKGLATDRDIDFARKVDELCEIAGLIVRPYENLCILSPPLIINKAEIDIIISIIENSIIKVEKEIM